MNAKSIKGKSPKEIQIAIEQSLSDGFKPTLAIVFLSIAHERKAITLLLDTKNITVFGATTNEEFISEDRENDSIAILLLDINKDYFKIYLKDYPEKNYREIAKGIAQKAKKEFKKPAFLISVSHLETDAEQLLFGFKDIIGKHVNVFGKMAGDNYSFTDQFVFTNGEESNRGTVVLALDEDKVKIKGATTFGWNALGTERMVTKSEGNHVYTADNIPVLDITTKYGGLENVTPENKDLSLEIATNFPLQLQREKGDPLMRPGLIVDRSDHSFYCSDTVPKGSKVLFSLPPDFDVMDKVIKGVQQLKDSEMPEADALVIFSCAGRIMSLGPLINQEIEGIKNVWNIPMAGMFSNAELARATGGNLEMHNLTTCCVALKEK